MLITSLCWDTTQTCQQQLGLKCIQKSCVSRKKRAHTPNKQRMLLHLQLCAGSFSSTRPYYVLTKQELLTIRDAKFRFANTSRLSGVRQCWTTYFHCCTLSWQHCNLGSAWQVQCMGMHWKMHPRPFLLSDNTMARTTAPTAAWHLTLEASKVAGQRSANVSHSSKQAVAIFRKQTHFRISVTLINILEYAYVHLNLLVYEHRYCRLRSYELQHS